MRTPTARGTLRGLSVPRGHLLVVKGAGHSVVTTAPTLCLIEAIHHWLAGGRRQRIVREIRNGSRRWPTTRPRAHDAQQWGAARRSHSPKTIQETEATWFADRTGHPRQADAHSGPGQRQARRLGGGLHPDELRHHARDRPDRKGHGNHLGRSAAELHRHAPDHRPARSHGHPQRLERHHHEHARGLMLRAARARTTASGGEVDRATDDFRRRRRSEL